jgi:uncharacterized membrane protein YvbJ
MEDTRREDERPEYKGRAYETDYEKHQDNPAPPKATVTQSHQRTTSRSILTWAVPVAALILILVWYLFLRETA